MIKSLKDLLDKFSRFTNSLVYDGGICKRLSRVNNIYYKFKYLWDSIKKAYKIKIEKAEKPYKEMKKWDIKYKGKLEVWKTSNYFTRKSPYALF